MANKKVESAEATQKGLNPKKKNKSAEATR